MLMKSFQKLIKYFLILKNIIYFCFQKFIRSVKCLDNHGPPLKITILQKKKKKILCYLYIALDDYAMISLAKNYTFIAFNFADIAIQELS